MSIKALRQASKEFDTYSEYELKVIHRSIERDPLDETLRKFPKIAKIISMALQVVAVFPIGKALKVIILAVIAVLEGIANEKIKQ